MRKIKRAINKALTKTNISIMRRSEIQMKKEKEIWKKLKYLPQVSVLIDIGVGPEGTPFLYKHFSQARMIFIDPLIECRKAVESYLHDGNMFITTALGSENSKAMINIARKQSRSSFHQRKRFKSQAIDKREVSVRRLDDLINEIKIKGSIGLKIDTEGHELSVLMGAESAVTKASFIILEFHYSDAKRIGYSLQDIIDFMHMHGKNAHIMLADGRNIVFI